MWIALAEHHMVLVMKVESGKDKWPKRLGRICGKKAAGFGELFFVCLFLK